MSNMARRTATESTTSEMRNIIIRYKKGLIAEDVEEEARTQAESSVM